MKITNQAWMYAIIGALLAATIIYYRRSKLPAGKPTKETLAANPKFQALSDRKLELITILTEAVYNSMAKQGAHLDSLGVIMVANTWVNFTEAQLEEFVAELPNIDIDAITMENLNK